eukprot:TRINITY_DN42710_c0_g2_i1.p1 TRINITY_DN42710_c0_g2~~TRINITY_DN42710_c0_g2_i1.p1  ORF type:complete len:194 (+),score=16.05 TRINITY_DN42710_c0_g2_i1:28-582(+)
MACCEAQQSSTNYSSHPEAQRLGLGDLLDVVQSLNDCNYPCEGEGSSAVRGLHSQVQTPAVPSVQEDRGDCADCFQEDARSRRAAECNSVTKALLSEPKSHRSAKRSDEAIFGLFTDDILNFSRSLSHQSFRAHMFWVSATTRLLQWATTTWRTNDSLVFIRWQHQRAVLVEQPPLNQHILRMC